MPKRAVWIGATVIVAALGVGLSWVALGSASDPAPLLGSDDVGVDGGPTETGWPLSDVVLQPLPFPNLPAAARPIRVYIDAGHGAENNPGNTSSFCVDEQDFTLSLAVELSQYLSQARGFEPRLSRHGDALTNYHDRVDEADAWPADFFVSLHSDVRGVPTMWSPTPGTECRRSLSAPGFSVLWSDDDPVASSGRLGLAQAITTRMGEVGFAPYQGAEYVGLYDPHEEMAGVFVDRHTPKKRIFVLYKPKMPSVIVETHNALDSREARRWEAPETRDAFFSAVANALVDAHQNAAAGNDRP